MNRGQILPHRVTPMSNVYSHEWSLWRRAAKSWPRMIFFFSKQPEQSSIWQRRLLTQQLACCQLLGGNGPARLKCSSSTFVLQLLLKTCQINSLKFFWGVIPAVTARMTVAVPAATTDALLGHHPSHSQEKVFPRERPKGVCP